MINPHPTPVYCVEFLSFVLMKHETYVASSTAKPNILFLMKRCSGFQREVESYSEDSYLIREVVDLVVKARRMEFT